ncbi:MAG: hypothetical protein AMXMBFR19_21660 [Chthonomonadaceae bacterium]|uniref:Uncharacterized protein n=1 Tax=Candidatus Nitrosymbiomonas proteolyticus TaxID=2608984 RepID=A0A809RWS1_9BACT|nr:hypothetical protein NPRO_19270 [Candidatus Nitrosymbiomonas proteolyticus]
MVGEDSWASVAARFTPLQGLGDWGARDPVRVAQSKQSTIPLARGKRAPRLPGRTRGSFLYFPGLVFDSEQLDLRGTDYLLQWTLLRRLRMTVSPPRPSATIVDGSGTGT